jgi:hypothetical protein
MRFECLHNIELDGEDDGRWIAEIPDRRQPESCFNLSFSINEEQLARVESP